MKRCINYADLKLGIDSSEDKSPPRKCKQSKAVALHEPSQTVIAARNQRVTWKSIQSSEYEHTKLIGTVIITPPAKGIKGEDDDTKKIKTEQDLLKLPKKYPKGYTLNKQHKCSPQINTQGWIIVSQKDILGKLKQETTSKRIRTARLIQ